MAMALNYNFVSMPLNLFEIVINAKKIFLEVTGEEKLSMNCIFKKISFFRKIELSYNSCWHMLWISCILIILITLIYRKFSKIEEASDSLKKSCYEVHHIAGIINPSIESIKTCIGILNEFPYFINHPKPPYNYTPFLRACWSGNVTLVRYMILNGADLHSLTDSKESPAYLAAYRILKSKTWNPTVLDLLYKAGDINHLSVAALLHLHCPDMVEKVIKRSRMYNYKLT